MCTISWRRPLILLAASVTLVTGAGCAAQAATPAASAPSGHTALLQRAENCGEGGEGGKGGAPGQPGEPGKPGKPGCLAFRDLPDKPKSELTRLDRARIVLTVLSGHATKAEVAKKYKVSEKEIDTWERRLLNGDWLSLVQDTSPFLA
ncbi:hypothetical protein [Streptomyces sp. NPDC013455]|uniref:hypothetical protein n=1 Tax=Streptomyces sp. NPDC013455 TaxID=3155605 RepID=UPI0033E19213